MSWYIYNFYLFILYFQLSDVQEMIKKFRTLTQRLEELRDEMRLSCDIADDHMWNNLVLEAEDIKVDLIHFSVHYI